ncbi:ABC transporter substrate-binding protein [Micromonospora schwarzwaldensis]|uniref:ABC transporter substrate-binding protein n=1 Tax=Micromonospora sp. DSM 45708 TaxID=3111767 RepID=UPI0031D4C5B3
MLAAVTSAVLVLGAGACGGDRGDDQGLAQAGATGTDDGSELTLWTRAPLEKQAKLLVEAYNAGHRNKVELTVVPNDDYVAKVGAAAGSGNLPDLFAADIVYVPNWVSQGLFRDLTTNIDGLAFKDAVNKGHLAAGTRDGREHVLPFVLDLSMLFWNKKLFTEAGLDPEKAPASLAEYATAARAVQAIGVRGAHPTDRGPKSFRYPARRVRPGRAAGGRREPILEILFKIRSSGIVGTPRWPSPGPAPKGFRWVDDVRSR